ncbi:MAG TPA: hypothetical protein VKV74_09650 [Bryobacteraceae bacterium]|nr:hypothetical protein [Bryobacteraceae bacterium]
MKRLAIASLCAIAIAVVLAAADHDTEESSILPLDHKAIQYANGPLNDPVTKLDRDLAGGKTKLEWSPQYGWLPSILKQLDLNVDSQMLVFSKTSFQASKIGPRAPRALFFNDRVMVGSVQDGDVLELASLDPKQGFIFYTLDVHQSKQPRFDRRDVCLQCHQGPATLGVPGIMIASVYPDAGGMPAFNLGMPVTDHRTPFQDRWGGWYVTGTHGGMRHRGNAVARDRSKPDLLDTQGSQNLTTVSQKFDGGLYLSRLSDIVALMTLEHQTRMTNLINRVAWETRIAQQDGRLNDPSTRARIDADIESMVIYMLFADEAGLYDTVQGASTFAKSFPERGPRDRQGRSLRDFDLQKRLFKYPLSYMVYSEAFNAMPDDARARVYRRLFDVLSGADRSSKFAKLSPDDRRNVLAILSDTKPDLPAYWKDEAAASPR